ncbi:MAG: agmatine deiminase family protein [candidate division Zixibacteria bacterium]|nr:agmatine deiminase family protein [candidate division Zixibacteria bacterium]
MRRATAKVLTLLVLIFAMSVWGKAHNLPVDLQTKIEAYKEIKSLPIELTPEEMTRLDEIGITHQKTAPPTGPARNPAEWEPMTGTIIRWPLGIPVSLIAEMSEDIEVWTIVEDPDEQASATSTYQSGGVNMDNAFFIIAPTNTIWTRDYGPWFIFDGAGNYGIVDHIYNRPRPDDDVIPEVIGNEWRIPVYGMDLTHTGGNHMSDGLGMSMSTRLVYYENPDKTEAEVDSIMKDYLGNDYTVLNYIESGGIHHIDCWAKFLNPTTILIKDVSPGHPSYHLLNQRADFLATQLSAWGRPYTIVRVYCPSGYPETAYTNSIILNNKVFVPISNSSWDTTALGVYQEAMPGYEVLGFYGSWYDNDAIHCRIMGVTDRYMLFVDHIPLFDTEIYDQDYPVWVNIKDHSGTGLISDSLWVYYSINFSPYDTVHLQSSSKVDSFYAYIPAQPPGTEISYYIKAVDNSGRVVTHPPMGAFDAHVFHITGENVPPQIVSADSFVYATYESLRYYPEIYDPDDSVHQITYLDIPSWCVVQNDTLWGEVPDTPLVESFTLIVEDLFHADTQTVVVCTYICGDANRDQQIDIGDVVYLINYLYRGGSEPLPTEAGDCNRDEIVDLGDVVYLINYLYRDGPPPCGM